MKDKGDVVNQPKSNYTHLKHGKGKLIVGVRGNGPNAKNYSWRRRFDGSFEIFVREGRGPQRGSKEEKRGKDKKSERGQREKKKRTCRQAADDGGTNAPKGEEGKRKE